MSQQSRWQLAFHRCKIRFEYNYWFFFLCFFLPFSMNELNAVNENKSLDWIKRQREREIEEKKKCSLWMVVMYATDFKQAYFINLPLNLKRHLKWHFFRWNFPNFLFVCGECSFITTPLIRSVRNYNILLCATTNAQSIINDITNFGHSLWLTLRSNAGNR